MTEEKIAIIGAGAAGCFAAANILAKPGREVVVLEKSARALQKVKVSGGGRCNATHYLFDVPELTGRYPRGKQFLRKTLYQFSPQKTIDWFERRGVSLKAEEDGRMFPQTNNSQTIIDCIWQEMMKRNVQVRYHKAVQKMVKDDAHFHLHFSGGTNEAFDKVLIACGGFPKAAQYHWLEETGHSVQPPVPSLFTFNLPAHPITQLMGVSVPFVTVKILGTKILERGPILITHWGLSGPVVLRASAWGARELNDRKYDFQVQVNWLGEEKEEDLRAQFATLRQESGKQFIIQKNPFGLPKRLWAFFTEQALISETVRWGELTVAAQNKLIELLLRFTAGVSGKTTFKEEFVTCGGISLQQINAETMESKLVPDLYFAGEILDVDGITGGFNFQHAWASGFIAAHSLSG